MNDINSEENEEKEDMSPRASARRAERMARRTSARSPALKRRTPDKKEEAKGQAAAEKPQAKETKTAPRAPRRKRPAAKPGERKTAAKKSYAEPPKRRTRRSASAPDQEEFELRSLPDGTQYRVKVSDKKKPPRPPVVRRRGDSGPGPAIIEHMTAATGKERADRKITIGSVARMTRKSVSFLKRNLGVSPTVAVILGSGLSSVADIVDGETIEFAEVPDFPTTGVPGHPGLIRAGMVEGVPTLFCEGRIHYYETGSMRETVYPIQTFLSLGVEQLILTTSAGALNPSYRTGDIMFVEDHLNLMGDNPLFGMDPQIKPSVFVDTSNVYDKFILDASERLCRRARVRRQAGTLAGARGPVYETPAEKNFIRSMGADAVCMSVIPEALAAAHIGVPVTALAVITNDASDTEATLSHDDVVREGKRNADSLRRLVTGIIAQEW